MFTELCPFSIPTPGYQDRFSLRQFNPNKEKRHCFMRWSHQSCQEMLYSALQWVLSSCITQHKQHFINEKAIGHLQPALTVSYFTSFINAHTTECKLEAMIFIWKRSENLWPMQKGNQQRETKGMNSLVLIFLFSASWEDRELVDHLLSLPLRSDLFSLIPC